MVNPSPSPWVDGRSNLAEPGFVRRVLTVVGIVTVVGVLLLLLWQSASVLLLLFAGVLFGVVLQGAATELRRLTRLPYPLALPLVVLAVAAVIGVVGWFLGSEIAGQFEQLAAGLHASTKRVQNDLQRYGWWPAGMETPSAAMLFEHRNNVFGQITGAVSSALGLATNVMVVVFLSIFVAAQPDRYRAGVIRLVPFAYRQRAGQVLDAVSITLRWWMGARLFDMAVVGVLTTVGLYLLGTPVPLALGLLSGLCNFIPYLGPVLSGVPALLVAITQGPEMALSVAGLFVLIHALDGNVLQPLIDCRSVDLPPGVIIGAQLLLGVLLGTLGVMFATPLVAAVVVAVKMLYVKDILGDPVPVKSEEAACKPQPAVN